MSQGISKGEDEIVAGLQSDKYADRLAALTYIRDVAPQNARLLQAVQQIASREQVEYLQQLSRQILSEAKLAAVPWVIAQSPETIFRWRWRLLALGGLAEIALGVLATAGFWEVQPLSILLMLVGGGVLIGVAYWARRKSQLAFVVGALVYTTQILVGQMIEGKFEIGPTFSILLVGVWCFEGWQAVRKILG